MPRDDYSAILMTLSVSISAPRRRLTRNNNFLHSLMQYFKSTANPGAFFMDLLWAQWPQAAMADLPQAVAFQSGQLPGQR